MKRLIYVLVALSLLAMVAPVATVSAQVECDEDYIVQADDWLSRVADKYYGDPMALGYLRCHQCGRR